MPFKATKMLLPPQQLSLGEFDNVTCWACVVLDREGFITDVDEIYEWDSGHPEHPFLSLPDEDQAALQAAAKQHALTSVEWCLVEPYVVGGC